MKLIGIQVELGMHEKTAYDFLGKQVCNDYRLRILKCILELMSTESKQIPSVVDEEILKDVTVSFG